jgi:uncharacterized membrane protein YeaQ/YmgE (transglycosylase-associated protein family)
MMATNSIIVILVIGLIAGWLAGKVMGGGGFGLIGDIVIGVIGAFIGGWLWTTLHLPALGPWWLTAIVSAVVGACILLFLIRLVRR